jgi:hypothetical protein
MISESVSVSRRTARWSFRLAAQESAAVERDLLYFINVLVGESRVYSVPRREVVFGLHVSQLLDSYRETVMLRQTWILQGLEYSVFVDSFEDADPSRPLPGSLGCSCHGVLLLREKPSTATAIIPAARQLQPA